MPFAVDVIKNHKKSAAGNRIHCPGDRIGPDQIFQRPVVREHPENPADTHHADAEDGDTGRLDRVAHAAQSSAEHIHGGTDPIHGQHNHDPGTTAVQCNRIDFIHKKFQQWDPEQYNGPRKDGNDQERQEKSYFRREQGSNLSLLCGLNFCFLFCKVKDTTTSLGWLLR